MPNRRRLPPRIPGRLLPVLLALLLQPLAGAEGLVVKRFVVNAGTAARPFPVNSYLVCHPASGSAALIDPGADDERFAAAAAALGVQVRLLLNTHGHDDHSAGNLPCRARFGAPLAVPGADRPLYEQAGQAAAVDLWLKAGQKVACGGMAVRVIATPGHTPGSVCFLLDGHLFSGDTLLAGGVGRVPGTDRAAATALRRMLRGIRRRLLTLPPDTVLWPGHGQPSTVGEEILLNPFLN